MKISVIGAGAMGGAMVEGFVKCGMLAAADITVSAPHEATLERFKSLGVNVTTDNKAATAAGDVVFVVVKSHCFSINVWFQCIVSVRKVWKDNCHSKGPLFIFSSFYRKVVELSKILLTKSKKTLNL